jgi:hypothetical protein
MNLDLIFALTSLFSRKLCLAANLNRYPADVICLFEFSPLFDPGGLCFCWSVRLGRSTVFRAAPSRGFIFQAQALRPVASANRAKSGTSIAQSENVRAWNDLHRWHGRGPAYLKPAKVRRAPARSAVSECCRARTLWKLWADATRLRAPKQHSNLRRCCGAPNGACITQIIGAR